MSLTVADLVKQRAETTFDVNGELLTVFYNPSKYTPRLEEEVSTLVRTGRPAGSLAALLTEVIIEWDLLGDDGNPYPILQETISELPTQFLVLLTGRISEEVRDEGETRKNSGGGSLRKGKSANRRTGTR